MKEKIENGPLRVRTYMVYLNVESDMDGLHFRSRCQQPE